MKKKIVVNYHTLCIVQSSINIVLVENYHSMSQPVNLTCDNCMFHSNIISPNEMEKNTDKLFLHCLIPVRILKILGKKNKNKQYIFIEFY